MPSVRVSKDYNDGTYFITMTVKRWHYLFDRHNRWSILLHSLRYCQANKGLQIYAWVFMINHIHLIVSSPDVSGFIRDFKKFTSYELKKNMLASEPHVLKLFEDNGICEIWERTNKPELIESESFFLQKQQYIENNPVKKEYVKHPEDWIYSSANTDNLLVLAEM